MWLNIQQFFKNYHWRWKFKLVICLPIFVILVAFDWISKGIVVAKMAEGQSHGFIPRFLGFHYVINPGAAYGFNSGNPTLAILLATGVTILLMIIFIFANDRKWLIALSMLLAGSFGNLLSRAWAPGGSAGVVDFLQWQFSFLGSDDYIFNIADAWVSLGIVWLILAIIYEMVVYLLHSWKTYQAKRIEATKRVPQTEELNPSDNELNKDLTFDKSANHLPTYAQYLKNKDDERKS